MMTHKSLEKYITAAEDTKGLYGMLLQSSTGTRHSILYPPTTITREQAEYMPRIHCSIRVLPPISSTILKTPALDENPAASTIPSTCMDLNHPLDENCHCQQTEGYRNLCTEI